jgi:hypothetical protein
VPNVQWKTPVGGQRNCPKHVEFLDKNKFGKLMLQFVLLKRNISIYDILIPMQIIYKHKTTKSDPSSCSC